MEPIPTDPGRAPGHGGVGAIFLLYLPAGPGDLEPFPTECVGTVTWDHPTQFERHENMSQHRYGSTSGFT